MNAQFQTTLSDFESKLNALVTSLTTSPTAAGAPAAAVGLLDADDSLTSAVETLRQHQANYARILKLRAEAESLEDRVKSIVRDVVNYEKEVRTTCGDDEEDSDEEVDSDSDDEDESERENEVESRDGQEKEKRTGLRHTKEVEYKLLLDFARRISKYNLQAASDAEQGIHGNEAQTRKKLDQDTEMGGTNTTNTTNTTGNANGTDAPAGIEPVSTVTKEATSWLDESANLTRQVYMLPYPMEDRIRMGLMGQIQLAAAEGRPGFDADGEVERLIREAEGTGAADAMAPVQPGEGTRHADEAAMAAAHAGSAASAGAGRTAPPPPKPKAMLDLDLYDPDDDD
ncbi:hypothetical protein P170DRAFT_435256 [Aspergillus steynii IBT 23096]|uniref:Mediator of RNA polymerase II transcription subunit 4 n=1 Tax=Aspergillus steynii IBT 23096 TaxID=1392250 RepID=A0A2I2GAU7_9EURO|nr:uncharacterized protein P170DRAFT_435256 [Aspergillus steynii IBT 23096]PLB50003.1 hypothetical protein P170DRAFT_435256 [Aspergillus steynii IBT 23096]